jgi:tetratricopeptide (TPR) repeat protein
MEESEHLRRATELWRAAYRYQMEGELDRAIEDYQRSIAVYPTAEAHTFLGWTLSFQGRLEEATAACLRAIEIDPHFGNPYNDIGVYLMQQGKLDEAIRWLEKAKQARRYEPRQFPFMNLGRVYLQQRRWWEALREFEGAVQLAPGDVHASKMLHELARRGGAALERPPLRVHHTEVPMSERPYPAGSSHAPAAGPGSSRSGGPRRAQRSCIRSSAGQPSRTPSGSSRRRIRRTDSRSYRPPSS